MISDHSGHALAKIQLIHKGWGELQISLWGRIQTIKMVIVPKLNFPLNIFPIGVLGTIFQTIDKMLSQFIWSGKRLMMKLTKLQTKYNMEG